MCSQVYQSRSSARMTVIKPKMDELTTKMKAAYAKKNARGLEDAEVRRGIQHRGSTKGN